MIQQYKTPKDADEYFFECIAKRKEYAAGNLNPRQPKFTKEQPPKESS